MRQLIALSTLLVTLSMGCKKTNSQLNASNSNRIYLLTTKTYTDLTVNSVYSDYYTYDNQNRVVEFKNTGIHFQDYKYAYDTNDNLTTVKSYDANGNLLSTDVYTINGTSVTVVKTDVNDNGGSPYSFNLNSQGEVILSSIEGTTHYTYDSAGNITGYTSCCQLVDSDTFTYDNKKHPLSMIGARNFHLMFLTGNGGVPETFVNNMLQDVKLKKNLTYTYNSDGFPINANTANFSIAYTYITK